RRGRLVAQVIPLAILHSVRDALAPAPCSGERSDHPPDKPEERAAGCGTGGLRRRVAGFRAPVAIRLGGAGVSPDVGPPSAHAKGEGASLEKEDESGRGTCGLRPDRTVTTWGTAAVEHKLTAAC